MIQEFQLKKPGAEAVWLVPVVGLEPTRPFKGPQDFKSCASAISPHRQCLTQVARRYLPQSRGDARVESILADWVEKSRRNYPSYYVSAERTPVGGGYQHYRGWCWKVLFPSV